MGEGLTISVETNWVCKAIPLRTDTRAKINCGPAGDLNHHPIPLRMDGKCRGKLKGTTAKKTTASPAWPGPCGHLQCDSLGTKGHVDINCGPGGDLNHHTISLMGRWEVLG